MKKEEKKNFLKNLYNKLFVKPEEESKNRRLVQDENTGKLVWSDGSLPFGEGPDEGIDQEPEVKAFSFEDNKNQGTRMYKPVPSYEPYRKNRFEIEFPGIPCFFFQSYSYLGVETHNKRRIFGSDVIKNDISSFKILMLFPQSEIDICEKLKELEESPKVGDVKINLLDPTGVMIKQILIPGCEVIEIKAFRELEYGGCLDKSDSLLYGEIIIKHKQRKLI